MSRLVIIAGLAVVLISLVGLAALIGGSDRSTTDEASLEPDLQETQDSQTTPQPDTTTPSTMDEGSDPGQTAPDEESVQGIRPSDREAARIGPRIATVEITGDSRYSCIIGRIDSPRTVRGTDSATYQVRVTPGGTSVDTVISVCQKIGGDNLNASIVYDNDVKAEDDTEDQFGTVSVSWSPMQQ